MASTSFNWSDFSEFVINEFLGAILTLSLAALVVLFFRCRNFVRRRRVRKQIALLNPDSLVILITDFSATSWIPRPRLYFDNKQRRLAALLKVQETIINILPKTETSVYEYPKTISWSDFDPGKRSVSKVMLRQANKVMSKTGSTILVSARVTPDYLLDVVFYSKRGGATKAATMSFIDTQDMKDLWAEELAIGVSLYAQSAVENPSQLISAWRSGERLNYLRTFSRVLDPSSNIISLSDYIGQIHEGFGKVARVVLSEDWIESEELIWCIVNFYKRTAIDTSVNTILSIDAILLLWTALLELTASQSDTINLEQALQRADVPSLGSIVKGLVDEGIVAPRKALLLCIEFRVRVVDTSDLFEPPEADDNPDLRSLHSELHRSTVYTAVDLEFGESTPRSTRAIDTAISLFDECPLLSSMCLVRLAENVDRMSVLAAKHRLDWLSDSQKKIEELISRTSSQKIQASLYSAKARLLFYDREARATCYQVVRSLSPSGSYPHVKDDATYRLASINCRRAEASHKNHSLFGAALDMLRTLRNKIKTGPYSYPISMGGNHARALLTYIQLDRARRNAKVIDSGLTAKDELKLLDEALRMLTDDLCNGVGFEHSSSSADAWNSAQWVSYLGLACLLRAQSESSATREITLNLRALFYFKAAKFILSNHQKHIDQNLENYTISIESWARQIDHIEGAVFAGTGAAQTEIPRIGFDAADEKLNTYLASICDDVDGLLLNSLSQ